MSKQPKDFDYSAKGYLFYIEYSAYCTYKNKLPISYTQMPEKILYNLCLKNKEFKFDTNIFKILSSKSTNLINKSSLIVAFDKLNLNIKDFNVDKMIELISKDKNISEEEFLNFFSSD